MTEPVNATPVRIDYTVDPSEPCKHGLGTIYDCGNRRDGSMYPYCAIGGIGENQCSQVIVHIRGGDSRLIESVSFG
jgi:hypothetical protein